jgi:hypothetical protein
MKNFKEALINGLFAPWRRCSRFLSSKYVHIFLRLKNIRAWPVNKNPHYSEHPYLEQSQRDFKAGVKCR